MVDLLALYRGRLRRNKCHLTAQKSPPTFFLPARKAIKRFTKQWPMRKSLVGLCSWIAFGNKVNKEMLWLVRQRRFMRVRHVRRIQFRDLFEYYGFFLMPERVWIWHLKGSATIIEIIPFYCLESRERLKH